MPPFSWLSPSAESVISLPGGFVDETGCVHSEVVLTPLTGWDEAWLAAAPADMPAAAVVTDLLARHLVRIGTLQPVTTSLVRDMLVGDRSYLILKLREMTFGKRVDAIFYCPDPDCGKPMDVTFSLDDIEVRRASIQSHYFSLRLDALSGDDPIDIIEFRLPTGGDQEAIAQIGRQDEDQAIQALIARCMRSRGTRTPVDQAMIAQFPPEAIRQIETAMYERAPHAEIEPEAVCPECKTTFVAPFDMASFFMCEVRPDHQRLERDVHLLARYYHWSEDDILSLALYRRRRYLRLIQEELEAQSGP